MNENDSMSAEATNGTDETVVILGNGFDLECGLPTKYSDFIRFVTCLEERWLESGDERANDLHPAIKETLERLNPRKAWKGFFRNYWYRHFKKTKDDLGWIDVEYEIARVVRSVEDSMINSPYDGISDINDRVLCEQHSVLEKVIDESRSKSYEIFSLFTILIKWCGYAMYFSLGIFLLILVLNPITNILEINPELYSTAIILLIGATIMLVIAPALVFSCIDYRRLKKESVTVTFLAVLQTYLNEVNPMSHGVFKYKTLTKRKTKRNGIRYCAYSLKYSDLREYFLKDFKEFIRAFESYLHDYVEKIEIKSTPAIETLLENVFDGQGTKQIICFNYTSTFKRVCKKHGYITSDYSICYIHGMLGDGKYKNRMVLGIDERLTPKEQEQLIAFAPFRKYYQRIYKETDNSYIDWLKELEKRTADENDDCHVNIFVFGHSLGVTDKEVLVPFFKLSNAQTTIYYHDQYSFGSLVANLTALLGMDEVIKYTSGSDATIRFIQQSLDEM